MVDKVLMGYEMSKENVTYWMPARHLYINTEILHDELRYFSSDA
jgi:hypothetical protein